MTKVLAVKNRPLRASRVDRDLDKMLAGAHQRDDAAAIERLTALLVKRSFGRLPVSRKPLDDVAIARGCQFGAEMARFQFENAKKAPKA